MEKNTGRLPKMGSRPLQPQALTQVRSVLLANAVEDLFGIMVALAAHVDDDLAEGAIQSALEEFRNKYHPEFDEFRNPSLKK